MLLKSGFCEDESVITGEHLLCIGLAKDLMPLYQTCLQKGENWLPPVEL